MFRKDNSIKYKTEQEFSIIQANGEILGKVHGEISRRITEGIKTRELDKIAYTFIKDNGAIPSFLNYNGFPASLCISVNQTVVHGIPGDYELRDGDIISVDCGVFQNGYHADSAYTYMVGNVSIEKKKLLKITLESLYKGIEQAQAGRRMGDIGHAIQSYVEAEGYGVVRELVGHGVGSSLHEEPEVPNYGRQGKGLKLLNGMVLAIEPMINMGRKDVYQMDDGWTINTIDNKPSAHFEHTIGIMGGKPEILTTFKYIAENQVING